MIAAVLADERSVGIVEMEEPRQLLGCGIAGEASVATGLAIREEADRHGGRLCRSRGFGGALAEQVASTFSGSAVRVDIGVERGQRHAELGGDVARDVVPVGH